jgi:hypothetical protein
LPGPRRRTLPATGTRGGQEGGDDVEGLQTDTDYEVYEGTVGDYYSHSARLCTTGGLTSATITPGSGSRYYLIVPRNTSSEGSYGVDSNGIERPRGTPACGPRRIDACF